ncbi:oxidoreductase [Streptomyces phage Enygma]
MGTPTRRRSKVKNPDAWWQQAYLGLDHIVPAFEFELDGEVILPKALIKFKNTRGTYKFRCVATNTKTGKTWIDCINAETGEWKSFYVERLKGLVKPKRSRRRRKVA